MNNTLEFFVPKTVKKSYTGLYKLILFLSFVWTSFYLVANDYIDNFLYGVGNLFDASGRNFATIFISAIFMALIEWMIFELCLWVYRTFLAFKIYSFVVSPTEQKDEARLFFAIKNFLLGIVINLSFFFPYLYNIVEIFNFIFLMLMLLAFAYHIQKKYSQPIIAHFVFKCFIYPVFVYECLVLIIDVLGVIL